MVAVGLLSTGCLPSLAQEFPRGNWLADGGFEVRAEAREIGLPSGSDRRDFGETFGWSLDTAQAWEGKRSLHLPGARPFTWRLNRAFISEGDAVFSVYARSNRPGVKVAAGFEVFSIDDHSRIGPRATVTTTVELSSEWQRIVVPVRVTKDTDQGHIRVHQLKTWIRPLTPEAGDVWLDAAQLEIDRATPGPFISMQPALPLTREDNSVLKDWFGPSPATDPLPPPPASGQLPSGEVTFTVSESAGLARHGEIATGGIPFGPGQVFDTTHFHVTTAAGDTVPSQTTILARRPHDGSAISVLVEIPAEIKARQQQTYLLHFGPTAESTETRTLITEDGESFTLQAGDRAWSLSAQSFPGFMLTTIDGREFKSDGVKPDLVEIERNGPLHAIIHYRGKLADNTGAPLDVSYDCRLHVFAGSDAIQVEMSYEQQERVSHLPVRSIGLTLDSPGTKATAPIRLFLKDPVSLAVNRELPLAATNAITLTQLHQYFGAGRYDLVIDQDGAVKELGNTRASGAVGFPDAAIAVEGFDSMNPAAIAWTPGHVTVYAQPPRHATYVELPFGISQTLRFQLGPPSSLAAISARSEQPLRVLANPAHTAKTGVFGGPFLTSSEARQQFPLYEKPLDAFFASVARSVTRQDTTGGFDFGDAGAPSGWKNNETSLIEALFLQYVRGGDPALFRRATEMERQFRDVAVLHAAPSSMWIQTHAAGTHTTGHFHIGHFWATGMVWHYLLTGDRRSYDTARGTAAELLSRYKQNYTGRERGRMLLNLAELYEITHYTLLREAFDSHVAHDVPMENGPYYAGLNIVALKKGYDVMGGSPELRERLLAYGRHVIDVVTSKDVRSNTDEDRDHFIFSATAILAGMTDDPVYVKALADRLAVQGMSAHGMGLNAVRGSEFLYQAARLGVPLSSLTPVHSASVAILSGKAGGKYDATLNLRIQSDAGHDTALTLYKQVGFRVGKAAADDTLVYSLTNAQSHAQIASDTWTGDHFETRAFTLSKATEYLLSIQCTGDAQVEVSAPGTLSLSSADWLFFRQHRHGNGFVSYDLYPQDGAASLTMALNWESVTPGAIAAVDLFSPDGTRVSRARWALPLGVDWDERGEVLQPPPHLELPLPATPASKSLHMEMEAAKWLGWRVETGLAEPWLTP
jgi:hypothetical protein